MDSVANTDQRPRWPEQQPTAQRRRLHPDAAQAALDRLALVRPDRTLTAQVAHAQWIDNHPAGPDTHVKVRNAVWSRRADHPRPGCAASNDRSRDPRWIVMQD